MADGHPHHTAGKKLRVAFFLTIVIFVVEVYGGLTANSLALLSDAGHVLTDLIALGLAWFAADQVQKAADERRTYGYHRTGILTALVNAITLILIVVGIGYEAIQRIQNPPEVTPWLMFGSAAVGIVVNLYISWGLRAEGGHNLNVRAAMLHVFGDVGASAAVILGGVIILTTKWYLADPLLSLAIALLIARGAWSILRETVDILMESTPKDLNVAQMVRDMMRIETVQDVHDLHVWSLAGGLPILTAHVHVTPDCSLRGCEELLGSLNQLLANHYGIFHTTIQFEWTGCVPNQLYCQVTPQDHASHAHSHAEKK